MNTIEIIYTIGFIATILLIMWAGITREKVVWDGGERREDKEDVPFKKHQGHAGSLRWTGRNYFYLGLCRQGGYTHQGVVVGSFREKIKIDIVKIRFCLILCG